MKVLIGIKKNVRYSYVELIETCRYPENRIAMSLYEQQPSLPASVWPAGIATVP